MPSGGHEGRARILRALPDLPSEPAETGPAEERIGFVSLPVGTHNLPRALSSFVGRRRDLEQVRHLLTTAPLVTITGPSGMGKTRLAVEVASHLPAPAGGVWMVELALAPATLDPDRVAEAVAFTLRVRAQPGQSFTEALAERLSPTDTVLVLDNCEHLADAAATVAADLLAACPGLSILATSQRPLGASGEQVWGLAPLSLPAPGRSDASSDAVALFHTRAKAINAGFVVTAEGAAAVAETCRRLDGIPLAIELAAARTAVLSPAEIAQLLEERFQLLTGGPRHAADRHQTLEAAMAWSYGLLSPSEQTLLRRLSIFAGGAGLVDVRAVCTGGEVARDAVLDLLGSLVSKSLVVADTTGPKARYRLLETVRAYGRMQLAEAGGDHYEVGELHAAWFAEAAERAWHEGVASGQPGAADALGPEHPNLAAALDWLLTEGDAASALQMGSALILFWKSAGHLREGREWLERALAMGGEAAPALRVRALWGVGLLSLLAGDVARATSALSQSLTLAQEHGLHRPAAEAQHLLAFIAVFSDDPLTALPMLEEAVEVARAAGDDLALLNSLILSGRALLFSGDTAGARQAFEECRATGRSLRPGADSDGLIGLTWVALSRGEHGLAAELLAQALPTVRAGGEPFETALLLSFAGELAWWGGELEPARAVLEEGAALARDIGAPFPRSRCLLGLARVALAEGDLDTAAQLAEEATQAAGRAHLAHAVVRCLHQRADVARAAGDLAGAGAVLAQALELATEKNDRLGRARSLRGLGTLARLGGDYQAAASHHLDAIQLHDVCGDAGGVADTLEALAGLAVAQDRAEHAARLLGAAHRVRQDAGSVRSPVDQPDHDVDTALARAALDGAGFEEAFQQGAGLSLEEAVALARRARAGRRRPGQGWAALTGTERQVVNLVSEGLTNREVAERLFISPRTVQGHLMKVFRKLGVKSRQELREKVRADRS